MSGEDIRAGDVVEGVGASICPFDRHSEQTADDRAKGRLKGRLFKVISVGVARDRPYLVLPGYSGIWCAGCFRKLEAAEDCFTEALHRLIPEPALVIKDITEHVQARKLTTELRALKFGGWR